MKRLLVILSFPVLALIVSSAVLAQSSQGDPRIGTWTLNVAKSKGNTRKSETRTYTQSGSTVTAHVELVDSDGTKVAYGFNATADGKDYPFTGQPPGGGDSVSIRRIGNAFVGEDKKSGKVLFTTRTTFSADGKVMTLTAKGTYANGQPINAVRFYDKQ